MERLYYLNRSTRHTKQYQHPVHSWENAEAIIAQVQSFLRGILADGVLNAAEAAALHKLLLSRSPVIDSIGFPLTDLVRRVSECAADGVWSPEELLELQSEFEAFVIDLAPKPDEALRKSALHIFTEPAPTIKYTGSEFVLSGQFAWGTKNQVVNAIESRGGMCNDRVRHSTCYLLVGSFVSEGWAHGSFGRKIEAAMTLVAEGHPINILSEEHWQQSLDAAT